jgi:hypothetical protein
MATISDLGVDGSGIAQPRLKNKWAITFQNMAGDSDPLRLQAITADRPKLKFEEIVLDRYNSKAYIAGKYEFEPLNITFEDDLNGGVTAALQAQLELQQNIIGLNAAPRLPSAASGKDYKFAIKLDLLDGNTAVVESWIMEGAWIQNVEWDTVEYTASESIKITVTFRYDIARQNINPDGVKGKATGGAGSTGSGFIL